METDELIRFSRRLHNQKKAEGEAHDAAIKKAKSKSR